MEPLTDGPLPSKPGFRLVESRNGVNLFVPDYGGDGPDPEGDGEISVTFYPPVIADPADRRAVARLARPARELLRRLDADRRVRGGPMRPGVDQLSLHLSIFLAAAQSMAAVGCERRRDRRGRFARSHLAYRVNR